MNYVSVFDILKIGVGPSSSHTLGPWRAARLFLKYLKEAGKFAETERVQVHLYGSLSLTGKGHGTDVAVLLGLFDADPETVPMQVVNNYPNKVERVKSLLLGQEKDIDFDPAVDIIFHNERLPYHPNGMEFFAYGAESETEVFSQKWYSIGGGFVIKERDVEDVTELGTDEKVPYKITKASDIKRYCSEQNCHIADLAWKNETALHGKTFVGKRLNQIRDEMVACIYRGCHTEGFLPGGLNVQRRAHKMFVELSHGHEHYKEPLKWLRDLQRVHPKFQIMLRWISCFAMAVNEENANFGRVVTAPTNGAAGVIPAVLAYFIAFSDEKPKVKQIQDFLLTAGVIGGLYKNGATISAAMGGCQAEIGVSSSMAAVALTASLGGTIDQALQAGEIAMEHHLGLTCDPIGGLVQIPCIERNTMGAIKAITASHLALSSDPSHAKVSLDDVIKTMWETSLDMNHKYKETSLGGLATNISVVVPEC